MDYSKAIRILNDYELEVEELKQTLVNPIDTEDLKYNEMVMTSINKREELIELLEIACREILKKEMNKRNIKI